MSVSFKVTVKSGSDFKSDALNYRGRFLASEKIIFGPSVFGAQRVGATEI